LITTGPLRVQPERTGADGSAVADCSLFAIAARVDAGRYALRLGSRLGDDVNHRVDGVGPPDGGTRTSNHFDPIDVIEDKILGVPKNTREQPVIDRAAVDEHEQLVRVELVEAAHRHRPFVGVDLRDVDARRQPKQIGHRRHAGAPNVIMGDDEDRRGNVGRALFFP